MSSLTIPYQQAHYRVLATPAFVLRIGEPSAALQSLLAQQGVTTAAFITAHNPGSIRLDDAVNTARQHALEAELATQGWHWLPGQGEDPAGGWPDEPSCLVPGISREAACGLARQFGQHAMVYCEADAIPQLVWIDYS